MIDKFLYFEEKSEITNYKYKFNDEFIWPYFRSTVYEKVQSVGKNFNIPARNIKKENNFLKVNLFKNPFLDKQRNIIFIQASADYIINENNKYFNKLVDYYTGVYSNDTMMIEFKSIEKYPENRAFFNIKYMDFIDNIVNTQYKLHKNTVNDEDKETAINFIKCLKDNIPVKLDEGFYYGLEKQVLELSIKIKYYHHYYHKLILQLKPRVMFFDNGCYGGVRACMIKIANSLGIVTAEFQHGNVGHNAYAYNYPKSFKTNKNYKMYLPKHYLTMGEYWNKDIRLPCYKQVIGNPYLHSKLKDTISMIEEKNCILIISDPTLRENNIQLIKDFYKQEESKKYNVIFRLHPSDRNNLELYSELREYDNVKISDNIDVYDDIDKSDIVIGCYSTVLYECIPFNKSIFIIEDELSIKNMDRKIGTWFKTGNELIKLLEKKKLQKVCYNSEYFWNSKWKENYINFIENIVFGGNI